MEDSTDDPGWPNPRPGESYGDQAAAFIGPTSILSSVIPMYRLFTAGVEWPSLAWINSMGMTWYLRAMWPQVFRGYGRSLLPQGWPFGTTG